MRHYELPAEIAAREGLWDIHAHVLPGIDDGARNWDMTLAMLQSSWDSGVRTVIATPHYLPWRKHPLSTESICALCEEAMRRASEELGIDMLILPGQELYYYGGLAEDLRNSRCLTLAGTRCILVEFAEGEGSFAELRNALAGLRRAGYRVVLAHAERYLCLREKGRVEALIEDGVYIQSNLQEVSGGRLDAMARWVRKQYRLGNIHCTASDMHNLQSRPPMGRKDLRALARQTDAEGYEALLGGNIKKLLLEQTMER